MVSRFPNASVSQTLIPITRTKGCFSFPLDLLPCNFTHDVSNSRFLEEPFFVSVSLRLEKSGVGNIGGKATVKQIQGKQICVRVVGRFDQARVREIGIHCLPRLLTVRFEITLKRSPLDTKLGLTDEKDWGEKDRPSLFSFNRHFLRTRLLGINYSADLKRKGGLQAVYCMPFGSCTVTTQIRN